MIVGFLYGEIFRKENADVSIVRLYNCPYFINGECSLRSHDDPLIDYWNNKYIAEAIIPHCPKGRAYCHVDVDTDNWSGDTLGLIRTVINGCRNYNGNAGEIVDIIEQILRRRDDMKDYSSLESLIVSRKWSEKKQAEARQEGREEAWDLARRIATTGEDCYTIDEVGKVFGILNILTTPVEELLAKDKKYQEEKKIHVGDWVTYDGPMSHYEGVVLTTPVRGAFRVLIAEKNGEIQTRTLEASRCTATGKHSCCAEELMALFKKGETE